MWFFSSYLDLGLDILDGVRGLHLKGDGLAREGLDEDLHFLCLGLCKFSDMKAYCGIFCVTEVLAGCAAVYIGAWVNAAPDWLLGPGGRF